MHIGEIRSYIFFKNSCRIWMQFSYTFCGSTSGLPFSIIQPNKRKGITVFQKQYRHHLNGDHLKGPLFDIRHKDERHFRGFCLAWPWPIVYKNIHIVNSSSLQTPTHRHCFGLIWARLCQWKIIYGPKLDFKKICYTFTFDLETKTKVTTHPFPKSSVYVYT